MNLFESEARIVITCGNRISPFLEKEIVALGYAPKRLFKTGVELFGTLADCVRLNINLRCASQVLFSIAEFKATNADELYRRVHDMPWEDIIPADGFFAVTSNVRNETITNNLFANVKLKDAVVDRFRERTGKRPDSGAQLNSAVVHLFWQEEAAEIFVDTSGETLSKHGYRKIPGKAPMLESLAAAVLTASRLAEAKVVINPMCGSGTLAIEAALILTGRVPGLFRDNYAFMHLCGYDEFVYRTELEKAEKNVIDRPELTIIAGDISEDAINISRINAGMAGVEELIQFEQQDFRQTAVPPESSGIVIFNPEYGDRLGAEKDLEEIYSAMGDFMKQQCRGYFGYIFTGNPELAKKIGLKPKRRIEFFNGKIDCRLLEYELYAGSREQPKAELA